ncbi:MAG: hypothetical protein WCD86_19235 [Ktedonobacteraceae bacterium]
MEEQLPQRPIEELIEGNIKESMNPVQNFATINFLQWLASSHPEVQALDHLPVKDLLGLVGEFDNNKPKDVSNLKKQE